MFTVQMEDWKGWEECGTKRRKKEKKSQAHYHKPLMPALGRQNQRQLDLCDFQDSQGFLDPVSNKTKPLNTFKKEKGK